MSSVKYEAESLEDLAQMLDRLKAQAEQQIVLAKPVQAKYHEGERDAYRYMAGMIRATRLKGH